MNPNHFSTIEDLNSSSAGPRTEKKDPIKFISEWSITSDSSVLAILDHFMAVNDAFEFRRPDLYKKIGNFIVGIDKEEFKRIK